jgi:RNA polymerase primary sigma factor
MSVAFDIEEFDEEEYEDAFLDPRSEDDEVLAGADEEPGGRDPELGNSIDLLLRDMRGLAPLTAAEERELGRRIERGDEDAKAELVQRNLRLLISVVKRYRGLGVPFADLIQDGYFGLSRAAEKFDHRRGYKFSTYATVWIRQASLRALSTQAETIVVPHHVRSRRSVLRTTAAELAAALGRDPTPAELADATAIDRRHVEEVLAIPVASSSLDATNAEDEPSVISRVVDESIVDQADELERERVQRAAREALQTLMPLERSVLELRFGFVGGDQLPRGEVGKRLGLTRGRVSLIEAEALKTLEPRLAHLIGPSDG